MWCDRCRADAAAEVAAETGRASCATCGHDLGPVRRPATDQARELLKRWSAGIDLEAASPAFTDIPATTAPSRSRRSEPATATLDSAKRVRIRRRASVSSERRFDDSHPEDAEERFRTARVETAHRGGPAPPHFDVHTAVATGSERRGAGSQIIGQMLAYAGVLALTLGTALVIWGYFGGPPDYAPTGWLIATGGQMLLFLGVVTLVAGSLEQTSSDVRIRVESLGERLIRIEQAASGHGLKGPHASAASFARKPASRKSERQRA